MSRVRSVDFLPEIFQTDANKQFLAATLDQLIQEPKFKKTQGYIGRTLGPGVDPAAKYVTEPDATRKNYQLEPGVCSLDPDTQEIANVITYPGITDALQLQSGLTPNQNQLYKSQYYSWDPFVNLDAFVNFSQYYWLPEGPDVVEITANPIPVGSNFNVTRASNGYTFTGTNSTSVNPTITLLRGGSYTFTLSQNQKQTVNYRVSNQSNAAYVIDSLQNPTLTLVRGNTYVFTMNLRGGVFPFYIKTSETLGLEDVYNNGVINNGVVNGALTFTVPNDAPDTLYYVCPTQYSMRGTLQIVDPVPGTGPDFWIQSKPSVTGQDPAAPNLTVRNVLGVVNNGTDLGTVTFNVPTKTAQNFYYTLNSIPGVDLLTTLDYDQIQNANVVSFLATYGGIDGITNLDGRTLVFTSTTGWGTVPFSQRYNVWRINIVGTGPSATLKLTQVYVININDKFTILFGAEYSNYSYYKLPSGLLEQIPPLTAAQDTLYYQDSVNPDFYGMIKLIDQNEQSTIFINEILGKSSYTAPNGVTFTNGLKIKFLAPTSPAAYSSEIVTTTVTQTSANTNILTANSTVGFVKNQEIVFTGTVFGGLVENTIYYVKSIISDSQFKISTTPDGLEVNINNAVGSMTATATQNKDFYVAGVGESIQLLPVDSFVTPESYVVDNGDSVINSQPTQHDYLTIQRQALSQNAWSRSNRWFHIGVLQDTAAYNGQPFVVDNNARAQRPILEFRGGIRLFDMGTQGKAAVNVIDFSQTNAFANVEGATSYTVNGYSVTEGSRIIFAADENSVVRNNIYIVNFVVPDTQPPLIAQPIITLTLADDGVIEVDDCTVCISGTQTGLSFWFDGITWFEAQQKTSVQQAPLFNIYDSSGISLSNLIKYPSSTFVGSKLFSYAPADGVADNILGFALKYGALESIGDIVFDNNLYNDSFVYALSNVSYTEKISIGTPREYSTRTAYQSLLGWQTAPVESEIPQQFSTVYDGNDIVLDVKINTSNVVPTIKVFVGSTFVDSSNYTVLTTDTTTTIRFTTAPVLGSIIQIQAISDQISKTGFFTVPINLENNALNANSPTFTVGTIRNHYESICENLLNFVGTINGSNNSRDLGNIIPFGLQILQQSAPMTLAGYFLRSQEYNIFDSIEYNSQEYQKFKAQLLETVTKITIGFETEGQILDLVFSELNGNKTDISPFYWSDMLPVGTTYTLTNYTVSNTTSNVFDTVQVYNYTSANFLGMNVYLNDVLLVRNKDYIVATDGPRITITTTLALDDVVSIQEYTATYGNFVPNTPSKMGLYPAWVPGLEVVKTTTGTATVIRGHDGSITPIFGDIRDNVLLEFEKRIYNNIKLDGNPVPLMASNVLPGEFRTTGYSLQDVNDILGEEFLSYVGWNKLDYTTQSYIVGNEFSYNYWSTTSKINNGTMPGAWRGIYRYFYDTEQPELTPWEMLGFSEKPTWWELSYGPAPYTADNLVLWGDLELGKVNNPNGVYYLPQYARPGLTTVIPVDSQGNLLSPLACVVGSYQSTQFKKNWQIGDGGPVEASWWNSSAYPFAIMRLLALTRPAKFFSLFADRDLYKYNDTFGEYLYNNRYRLDANGVQVYGNGVSKASYINWIVDYNRNLGLNSTTALQNDLQNLEVRLCYRMGSFSEKSYIEIYTEKSSPTSTNTSLLIPDDTYDLLVYKNQPFDRTIYSSVVVQKVNAGFAVFGYSTTQPYFTIAESQLYGPNQTYTVGNVTVNLSTTYTGNTTQIAYGHTFTSATAVGNFLLGYGHHLESQGLSFTDYENGYVLTWAHMVEEFLYWVNQGWQEGSLINLNPLANGLSISQPFSVVDDIQVQTAQNLVLNQNKQELASRNLNIVRLENNFKLQPLNGESLSYADLRFTSYENIIVFNNASAFGDLIYDPVTAARQSRLMLVANTTTEWNGSFDAQGFIFNSGKVDEWSPYKKYAKGELVTYKNNYWSAQTTIQPTAEFNYNDWVQSDYTLIQRGLLPNLANKANQLSNSYNINTANLESDNDLLSYGLIGYRPRQYLAALNLDDVSQINVYRQFLGTKGTLNSVKVLGYANLGKEQGQYDVYENWAILRGTYGANANRSYYDLRLNRAYLNSNPSIVQVINPDQESQADQSILLTDVWKSSFKLTTPNILPTTIIPINSGLPSAGYVNLDDVDFTVFSFDELTSLAADINQIQVGTSIWVAKVNDYNWDIYRAQAVPATIAHVCDNLNGTCRVIFDAQHGLSVNDILIIRFFDPEVNGVYKILAVPNLNEVTVALRLPFYRTVVDGIGTGFTLNSMRVAQASDVANLSYTKEILPGAQVWVDDNGQGLWQVLEKQNPFTVRTSVSPRLLDGGERFGSSVAQTLNKAALFAGSPRYGFAAGTEKGAVYMWVKGAQDTYTPVSIFPYSDMIISLDTTGVRALGTSLSAGRSAWIASGAPDSLGPASEDNVGYALVIHLDYAVGTGENPYIPWQLLPSPNLPSTDAGEFGYSVAVSQDEQWMYIGAPGINKVYAYGLVTNNAQAVNFIGDGSTTVVDISSYIQINNNSQILVTIDGVVQILGTDYTISGGFGLITFTTAPAVGATVTITRNSQYQLDYSTYINVGATGGGGTNATFTIVRQRGEIGAPGDTRGSVSIYNGGSGYSVGNTLTIPATSFDGGSVPTNNLTITVVAVTGTGAITQISIAYTAPALTTTFTLKPYLFTVDSIYSFSIFVDSIIQRSEIDYTWDGTTLTFLTVPVKGASIFVKAGSYYQLVATIDPGASAGDRFGSSISCATDGSRLVVGSANDDVGSQTDAGSVYVYDRDVQRFIYGEDPSSVDFTVLGTVNAPVSVTVNGNYLTNQTAGIINGPNTFAVSGNTVTINSDLIDGDIIEISTNNFSLVQQITQDTAAEFSNFGQAVEMCFNNCSIYTGVPQSSISAWKGGVVQRNVNVTKLFGTITATVANPALTVGDTIRVNNMDVAVPASPNNTALGLANAINAKVPNVVASVANGYLTIAVKNFDSEPATNKLNIAPGSVIASTGAYAAFGFNVYQFAQTIESPYPTEFAGFGTSLSLNSTATNLVVGAINGTLYLPVTFDYNTTLQKATTIFDGNSTTFFDPVVQSGSVYTYDYLPSGSGTVASATTSGAFVFGQQISTNTVQPYDEFGIALSYKSGLLAVGSPGQDQSDSSSANFGAVFLFENPTLNPAWMPVYQQQPSVDIRLLNSVFMYDRLTSAAAEYFDFFDPLQGKILGAAQQNLNYISAVDPAGYNVGPINNNNMPWQELHIGEMWWDTSTVRFIDPNQDSVVYASRRWGQIFPGSQVNVYQWVASLVPPADYTGPGTPRDLISYSVETKLSTNGVFLTTYYFWVQNITTVFGEQGKTLDAQTVSQYIAEPKSSGIAYIAPINASTIAIYNAVDYIIAADTIISIEFDQQLTNDNVHTEYELFTEGRSNSFISSTVYRKLLDSFCGVDISGNLVPDPNLPISQQYGVQFRPRQSMFANRYLALENYIVRTNKILAQYPVAESKNYPLLDSVDPLPKASSGTWDAEVANLSELGYQDIYAVPLGYRYLVDSDSDNNGRWSIYTVQINEVDPLVRDLVITKVQNFVTPDYWNYVNWYMPGYNSSIKPVAQVATYGELQTLTSVPVGASVKVTSNSAGKWEIYVKSLTGWDRVGLQDGTIEISAEIYNYALGNFGFDSEVFDIQYFDQEPVIETRTILQAINEEIFVGELEIERNRNLTLMFNFILSEFLSPDWLVKTSLIDVDHRIRQLIPYPNYVKDNQEFVSDYIQEVKPYHVQIRAFNLAYDGNDLFRGDITDYDLPAYYNTDLAIPQYTSPILLPYTHSTYQTSNVLSDVPASSTLWQTWPYSQWYNNYTLSVESVIVKNSGSGYVVAPTVAVVGNASVPAELVAVINGAGQVISINVVNPGSGYTETPTIQITGYGSGADAYVLMTNNLVRNLCTVIKYDRCQYQTSVLTWDPGQTYENGTLVRYNNAVWRAQSGDGSTAVVGPDFNYDNWVFVPAGTLSGVDRTMGYYNPSATQPGLELPLLIDGVDYPGVQVFGPDFLDVTPLDTVYASSFSDQYLGLRPTDINVEGGQFVGVYEGHAPEELVSGSEYDTLDFRVYTEPGSNWAYGGHGYASQTVSYTYNSGTASYSWANLVQKPVTLLIYNATTQLQLPSTAFTTDWVNQTISIVSGFSNGDTLVITVYELGGGNELYRENYLGSDIVNNELIIPVNAAAIEELVVFVDGDQSTQSLTFTAYAVSANWSIFDSYNKLDVVNNGGNYYRALQDMPAGILLSDTAYWFQFVPTQFTMIEFTQTFNANDGLFIAALGTTTPIQYYWSTPQTEVVTVSAAQATSQTITATHNLGYTNIPNLIVCINGQRLRPYEGIRYVGDSSTISFALPTTGGYSQASINAATDVTVWVDGNLQSQSTDYYVTNAPVPGRAVVFNSPPAEDAVILIAVGTAADYLVTQGSQLIQFNTTINQGDEVIIISANDTRQQDLLTEVFAGNGGVTNNFDLERTGLDPRDVWVTLDGYRLTAYTDYVINGSTLTLLAGPITVGQLLAISSETPSSQPNQMVFRIFQDMRGIQATYRITPETTTFLTQDLSATSDIIYVDNASALSAPDLPAGRFGVVSINGERILYRVRDTVANTLSGLQRGTGGTGAAEHVVGSPVYNFGQDNVLPAQYQDYVVKNSTIADGVTTTFTAPDIDYGAFDGTGSWFAASLEVYVGGVRQYAVGSAGTSEYSYNVTAVNPVVTVEFVVDHDVYPELLPPAAGAEVTILQRRGTSWYEPGSGTASNGIALQLQTTTQAEFLQGK